MKIEYNLPRIIKRAALDAAHGSPCESRSDFAMPFPVPGFCILSSSNFELVNKELLSLSMEKHKHRVKPAGTAPRGILIAFSQSSLISSPFSTY